MLSNLGQKANRSWSWRNVFEVVVLALLYFASGKASFALSVSHETVTLVVFAAEGFALAATILYGQRISCGILVGQLLLGIANGLSLPVALAISVTNTVEALIGRKLFYQLNLNPNLNSIKDVGYLHLLIILVLQPFSATLGTTALYFGGALDISKYPTTWLSWWFGNSLGQILITPVVLSILGSLLSTKSSLNEPSKFETKKKIIFPAIALTITAIVGWLTFNLPGLSNVSTAVAVAIPLIVLIALGQGMSTVSLSVLVVVAIALQATSKYVGPFIIDGTPHLLDLNVFLLGTILIAQYVAVVFAERQQAEVRLQVSSKVFESAYEGIVVLNSTRVIVDVNPAFTQIAKCEAKSIIGQDLTWILAQKQDSDFCTTLWQTVENEGFWRGEVSILNQAGESISNLLTVSTVQNSHHKIVRYIALFSDITKIKKKQNKYRKLALLDQLTGLPNRRLLLDLLQQQIHKSKKNKKMVAVCYIDLDGFKQVNDTLGHEAGDKLLIAITSRFQNCL